jgi:hypothetical protein
VTLIPPALVAVRKGDVPRRAISAATRAGNDEVLRLTIS